MSDYQVDPEHNIAGSITVSDNHLDVEIIIVVDWESTHK
jgi:hypothetical protein